MHPPLAPHPPPTQSTRKVLYAPTYCPSVVCVRAWVRVWAGYRGKEEQGHVPVAKWDRGTASFNQIALLIGDTGDRRRRAVRDTCHSLFQSHVGSEEEKKKKKRTRSAFFPCYLISICSDISSRHVRHITTPFPSAYKCQSHFAAFKAERDQ